MHCDCLEIHNKICWKSVQKWPYKKINISVYFVSLRSFRRACDFFPLFCFRDVMWIHGLLHITCLFICVSEYEHNCSTVPTTLSLFAWHHSFVYVYWLCVLCFSLTLILIFYCSKTTDAAVHLICNDFGETALRFQCMVFYNR